MHKKKQPIQLFHWLSLLARTNRLIVFIPCKAANYSELSVDIALVKYQYIS